MATFSRFNYGNAVHGLLPFMSYYGREYQRKLQGNPKLVWTMPDRVRLKKTMKKVLRDYAKIPEYQLNVATEQDLENVWQCWDYLLDIMDAAERTSVEPLFSHSGKRPDLVCWHRGRVYVIEVKTIMKHRLEIESMTEVARERLMQQVRGTRDCLRQEPHSQGHEVLVYALLFGVGMKTPPEPVWSEIGRL